MQPLYLNGHNGPRTTRGTMLASPIAYHHLPQVVWVFDPDPREPQRVRRTALTVARLGAVDRSWELN